MLHTIVGFIFFLHILSWHPKSINSTQLKRNLICGRSVIHTQINSLEFGGHLQSLVIILHQIHFLYLRNISASEDK